MEQLADELRAIIHELAANTVPPENEEQALALARELRGLLDGPRRQRWYDTLDGGWGGEGAEEAFLAGGALRGLENPLAPPMAVTQITRADGSEAKLGIATLGMAFEGPPHGVHGGYVAALFDDILGAAEGLAPNPGVTAKLIVRYRNITPIEEELRFEAWIDTDEGRRITAKATCHAGDVLTAEAEALFIRVDFSEIQAAMQARRDGV